MVLTPLLVLFGVVLVTATILPLIPSNEWWIRIWEFPRIQITAVIILVLFASAVVAERSRWWNLTLSLVLGICLTFQLYRIWPYTPLHAIQAKFIEACPKDSTIRLLTANVLQNNRNSKILLSKIGQLDPDLVLLVETDSWWHEQLQQLQAEYPIRVSHPSDGGYGMHLLSRYPLIEPELRFLIDEYVPSIRTRVRLPTGTDILLYGLHPKPPPRADTAQRDAELLVVAREVRQTKAPTIVAGDLNDVAWSRTNHLFQEASGLLDPRIGRGIYATFNVNWPLLRWPLDHIFFSDSFLLHALEVLPDIGSDHFPLFASLCHRPSARRLQQKPRAEPQDRERVRDAIQEGREEASEKQ